MKEKFNEKVIPVILKFINKLKDYRDYFFVK